MTSIVALLVSEDVDGSLALCGALGADPFGARLRCEASRSAQAPERIALLRPEVVLLDGGADMLQALRRLKTSARVLLRTDAIDPSWVAQAVYAGAAGCLLRSAEVPVVARALRSVSGGDIWFGRGVLLEALKLHERVTTLPAVQISTLATGEARLTTREEQILDLIGRGMSNKEIGRELSISDKTVKTHLHRVYVKLHQSGRYKALLAQNGERMTESGSALRQVHP